MREPVEDHRQEAQEHEPRGREEESRHVPMGVINEEEVQKGQPAQ